MVPEILTKMLKTEIVCGFRNFWRIVKLSIPHSWGKIKMSFCHFRSGFFPYRPSL